MEWTIDFQTPKISSYVAGAALIGVFWTLKKSAFQRLFSLAGRVQIKYFPFYNHVQDL